ncbi:tripartite motif-containing protein 16 [Oryzias melastigma]|uniref:tripartite motif-containing protein 16 n=1 Tax=Oryzias melastigma TaxID=30732 RepID=UPI00168CEFD7|nr:tripartite motif-containing protein 16 [Oryzias melastigma]
MAQGGSIMDPLKFACSICLDLLKEPVTIPCGHNYCMDCIKIHWNGEAQRKIYSCPQCRRTFSPRPVLEKNIMLAELVEELKKTELRSTPADLSHPGPEGVFCDVCSEMKMKAVKSCLDCLASYCEEHLRPHSDVPALRKHKLVGPSGNLHQNVCSLHDEVMKIFCRTDQRCICYLCLMDEHKNHETVSAAAEFTEKQKKLEETRQQVQQRIESREKDMKELQQEVENINTSADKAVEDSEEIFNQMIILIQKRSSEVKQKIRSQQEAEVSRVLDLQEELEQEISDLKSKDREMETLSNTEDHSQFLHRYSSLSALSQSTHSSGLPVCPLRFFEEVTKAAADTKDKLQELLRDKEENISMTEAKPDVLPPKPEPMNQVQDSASSSMHEETRENFLQYTRKITLDLNTAHELLEISEGNRTVTMMRESGYYLYHPDRFDRRWQVLSKQSLTGRCYWEVEWSGAGVQIAVTYKSICRDGDYDDSSFGLNEKSWALHCRRNSYTFYHDSIDTPVSGPDSSTIGVYLDHGAGVLAFYSVSETMTLLHRVQTRFRKPLHVGIWLSRSTGTTVEILKLKGPKRRGATAF